MAHRLEYLQFAACILVLSGNLAVSMSSFVLENNKSNSRIPYFQRRSRTYNVPRKEMVVQNMKRHQMLTLDGKKMLYMFPGFLLSLLLLVGLAVNMISAQRYTLSVTPNHQPATIEFPTVIPGTSLTAERTAVYDGPFLEDGSNDEVSGIVALVLRNGGTQPISKAEVVLQQGDRRLVFRADTVPPGESVLVLEHNRSPYRQLPCSACYGYATYDNLSARIPKGVSVSESGINGVTLWNTTDSVLEDLWVYHKGWLEMPGILVGGITHKTHIDIIEPGEGVQIFPEYYAYGYSKIVQITASKSPH